MQFNSLLFPGPGMEVPTNMQKVVYIPRGALPEPDGMRSNFKDQKIGSQSTSQRSGSGIFSCMSSSQPSSNSREKQLSQSLTLTKSQPAGASAMAVAAQEEIKGQMPESESQVERLPAILRQKCIAKKVHAASSTTIPAMFIKNQTSSKLMLYFHGNAEDLALAEQQMQAIANYCNVNVLGMEFPGYGLYQGNGSASEEKIKEDAEYVYKYCIHEMDINEKDIIVFGRSMGSGPAAWLAGQFQPGALCIMSGYTSIKRVARDQVGWLRFFVAERFENINMVAQAKCPTFILHGRQDEVIPFHHGEELAQAAVGEPLVFVSRPQMTHNDFNLNRDLLRPMQEFLTQAGVDCMATQDRPCPQFKQDLSLGL